MSLSGEEEKTNAVNSKAVQSGSGAFLIPAAEIS
jgi:hypothetical protein